MARLKPGKLEHEVLSRLLASRCGASDRAVLVGPRLGEDAAVVRMGPHLLVIATDPVTFAAARIGWYAVQINANDVASMGATPRWFQACVLLPPGTRVKPSRLFKDIHTACRRMGVAVTGGHTEVTAGIREPIVVGTMLGVVRSGRLVTSAGLRARHDVLMTGSAAIEATALLARDHAPRLRGRVPKPMLARAANFLFDPGISVVRAALIASDVGVSAMHDPTEGGMINGLWELAHASARRIVVDVTAIPVREETRRLTEVLGVDPLRAIASGSLLIGCRAARAPTLLDRFRRHGIVATRIGKCVAGSAGVVTPSGRKLRPRARDEIAYL